MILHESKDDFEEIILQVSMKAGIRADVLEKDYYVTLMLEELARNQEQWKAYFKGGTALYKALLSINRFSEDIDLTVCVDDVSSNTQKKKRLELSAEGYSCLKKLSDDQQSSKGKGNITTVYGYDPIFNGSEGTDPLQRFGRVKIEATSFTKSEPVEPMLIAPALYLYAQKESQDILDTKFNVRPFKILTIKLERIFIDKVFATEFYYQRYRQYINSRTDNPSDFAFDVAKHLYDLMVLFTNEKIRNLFTEKVNLQYLIGLKREEEQVRSGGIPSDCLIKDFRYLHDLLTDMNFHEEYLRMQNIYVFREQDKIPLSQAEAVIAAIRILEG
ncbi:nucleotidyl transferase AbiEii/AbiGii toxin family protein [Paenibacillus sp. FSL R7-0333]|uniref:nucleotidyl transferase AbiEii/AbiGii toxin family protein n=1 Tax=Paenibacillus sp. FSL R7-0333 TaxID=1926587 RepID=UPI00096EC867|nr:hypothetical protein BK146_19605 [Paenibacillus sp. FSL R7-0333]